MSETQQVRLITVGTWTLSILLYLVPYWVLGLQGGDPAFLVSGIVNICLMGAAISTAVYAVAKRVSRWSTSLRALSMAAAVLLACGVLTAYDALSTVVMMRLFPSFQSSPLVVGAVVNFVGTVWPFALLASVYSLMQSQNIVREREGELSAAREATNRAEVTASAAQLAALRYQLNPHFLFNTLNAISSLIVTRDYGEADAMLAKLSEFLRATLAADPEGMVPLEHELATLQHYLEIEGIRFGDRLEVEFKSQPEIHDALVPSFVLQPLIENAIKYAVAPSQTPVNVRLEATQMGADLVITVEDDGATSPQVVGGGTGVGLANVRKRLSVLFGERGSIEAVRRERGFIAIMRLPLFRQTPSA